VIGVTYYVICGIICIGCVIGIVYCLNKLKKKQDIDKSELFNYQDKLKVVINELKVTEEQNDHYKNLAEEA